MHNVFIVMLKFGNGNHKIMSVLSSKESAEKEKKRLDGIAALEAQSCKSSKHPHLRKTDDPFKVTHWVETHTVNL